MLLPRVAVFGVGLIGGSLALRLKETGAAEGITLWSRSPDTREAACKLGFEHVLADLEEAAAHAGIAVLCTPVPAMRSLGESLAECLPESAVVTDAGSTKADAVDLLEPLFGGRFVGAHPIAGSERSGIGAAKSDLYEGAPCILTPTDRTHAGSLNLVTDLWRTVGCHVTTMSPTEHDALLARLSHLPHVVASALVRVICGGEPSIQQFSGGGYRDTTRIASGSASLWTEILMANRIEVVHAIRKLSGELEEVASLLDSDDAPGLRNFLEQAKSARDQLKDFRK